jgi:hypothetical protein
MGTTLAHTHANLMPTHAAANIGTLVAYLWRISCKTRANLCGLQSWHTCCNARIMPSFALGGPNVDTGGGV